MSSAEVLDKTFHFIVKRMDPDYFSNMKNCFLELFGEVGSNDKIGIFLKS